MYTPAVPHMTEHFDTSEAMVNLTLVGYFLFFAVGLLAFGPASDRYGRKPVLVTGILTYALASEMCIRDRAGRCPGRQPPGRPRGG